MPCLIGSRPQRSGHSSRYQAVSAALLTTARHSTGTLEVGQCSERAHLHGTPKPFITGRDMTGPKNQGPSCRGRMCRRVSFPNLFIYTDRTRAKFVAPRISKPMHHIRIMAQPCAEVQTSSETPHRITVQETRPAAPSHSISASCFLRLGFLTRASR